MATLSPFTSTRQLPTGTYDVLPVTRGGVRFLQPSPFETVAGGFRELTVAGRHSGHFCRGICGLLPATAFTDGTVQAHERTLLSRLEIQEAVFRADGGAIAKPVLLTTPTLTEWWRMADERCTVSEPSLHFAGVNQEYILRNYGGEVSVLPLPGPPLVIADGHHRAETFARLSAAGDSRFDQVPVVVIGAEELAIGTFLRVIDVAGEALSSILDRLSLYFEIAPASAPVIPRAVGNWLMSFGGHHFQLRRATNYVTDTDAGWLNETVLPPVFGIRDSRNDPRYLSIDPPPRPNGILEIPAELQDRVLLYGFPLPAERFFAEVAQGRTLPPKSTRFEPRVPSGLLVYSR